MPGLGSASPPGVRLCELRQGAELSLVEPACRMGRAPGCRHRLVRMEAGSERFPSIVLAVDFLHACDALFADIVVELTAIPRGGRRGVPVDSPA